MEKHEKSPAEEKTAETERTIRIENRPTEWEKMGKSLNDTAKGLGDTVKAGAKIVTKTVGDTFEWLVDHLVAVFKKKTLSYEEVMKYLYAHKNDRSEIKKGVLYKMEDSEGYLFVAAFLDKDNEPVIDAQGNPIGCKWSVEHLDDELLKLFKDKNMVLIQ